MEEQYKRINQNTFAKKIKHYKYEFVRILKKGNEINWDEPYEYFVIKATTDSTLVNMYELIDYSKTTAAKRMHDSELSKEQTMIPFEVCLYLFNDIELGNEEWNRVYTDDDELKMGLLEEFNIQLDAH